MHQKDPQKNVIASQFVPPRFTAHR